MAPLRRPTFAYAIALAGACAACTGELLDVPAGPSSDSPWSNASTASNGGSEGGGDAPPEEVPLTLSPLVVRRLSRFEYNNTVRDLFGTQLTPADALPADGTAEGFDTVGSALSLSPLHVIAYERAAHDLVNELFASDSEARRRILSCDVEQGEADEALACAGSILSAFARRAFRRPVTQGEIDAVLSPFRTAQEVGATRTEGIKHSLAAVLISPFFIFKIETDEDPSSTEPHRLSPHELATRLSYSLWSTLPDDALMASADSGALTTDDELAAQIERMLDDPRADALLLAFAGRWLELAEFEAHEVSADIFPEFAPEIARSMTLEASRFFGAFLRSDQPATKMLTAGFTYVDAALASYYGLPFDGSDPDTFVRVDTAGSDRTGLLTLGALLTTTSFSSRTSIVRRGEFVFSRILCQHVPPPPPGVEGIPTDGAEDLTLRQRFERHRADPACAGCHTLMDPLGFGLEHYDAIGRYRTHEGSRPVDATGKMPDGTLFDGAAELSRIIEQDPRFAQCITKKFLTYAGGRLLDTRPDYAWIEHLTSVAQTTGGGSLRSVIRTVLLSEPFRSRVPSARL